MTPRWLDWLEKRLGWLAVPNIAILMVTLQALGFLMVTSDPVWLLRLALVPERVMQGEIWRLLTFLSLPLSLSLVWVIFVLWFLYFVLNLIENEWGAFKTTFYVLISVVLTIAFSFAFDYPVVQISHFQSTLFLAAAALFPETEITIFFVIPAKMKWLAWLSGVFIALELLRGGWIDRLFLVVIYSNFLVFFGPAFAARIRQAIRKQNFKRKMRG